MTDRRTRRGLRIQAFYGRFLAPLLEGETVTVDGPLTPTDLTYAEQADYATAEQATQIAEALDRHTFDDAIHPRRITGASLAYAFALYDLALATDSTFRGRLNKRRRQAFLQCISELVALTKSIDTRADVLLRDVMLTRFVTMTRVDTTYHYWLGKRRFEGRPVPSSLLVMPKLRRVRSESHSHPIDSSLSLLDGEYEVVRRAWQALHRGSPMSRLCDPALGPDGVTDDVLRVAIDPELRSGIVRRFLRMPIETRANLLATILEAAGVSRERASVREGVTAIALETMLFGLLVDDATPISSAPHSLTAQRILGLAVTYVRDGHLERSRTFTATDARLLLERTEALARILPSEPLAQAERLVAAVAASQHPLFANLKAAS